jgi:hypothetical protein
MIVVTLTDAEADEIRGVTNGAGDWVTADGVRAMIRRALLTKLVGDADPRFPRGTVECNLDGTKWRDNDSLGRHLVEEHGLPEGSLITPYVGSFGDGEGPALPPGEYTAQLVAPHEIDMSADLLKWRLRLGYAGPSKVSGRTIINDV